jgi:hypothetical protein
MNIALLLFRYFEVIRDARPNKGTILKSSVDFIKCLKQENERLKQVETINKQMEQHTRRLMLRIQVSTEYHIYITHTGGW